MSIEAFGVGFSEGQEQLKNKIFRISHQGKDNYSDVLYVLLTIWES